MNETVLIAIVAGLVSVVSAGLASIPGIVALRQHKRKLQAESDKTNADAAEIVQKMTLALITPYQARVGELEKLVIQKNKELAERVGKLECDLDNTCALLVEVADCAMRLHGQVSESGGIPVCIPPTQEEMEAKLGREFPIKPKKRGQ